MHNTATPLMKVEALLPDRRCAQHMRPEGSIESAAQIIRAQLLRTGPRCRVRFCVRERQRCMRRQLELVPTGSGLPVVPFTPTR
jgi:hypothetical protein